MHTQRSTRLSAPGACIAVALCLAGSGTAAHSAEKVTPRALVVDLDNPCGVVVHPEAGHVFIASRHGVYRYDPDAPDLIHFEVLNVTEPTDVYGEGPRYAIGPLGLDLLDSEHLVVGDGSRKDGEEQVRIYKIDPSKREQPHQPYRESEAAYSLGPIEASEKTSEGEGNFYGVAVGAGAIFVTCNGDDTKGWVAKAELKDGKPGDLKLAIATKVATGVDAPAPITFTPDSGELVIGQMGEIDVAGDSLLTFYDPNTGELKRNFETGLFDVTGLAYSSKNGKLYATDFAWMKNEAGGLFELAVEGDRLMATKIISLDKPTALAFDQEGNLFVTVIGTAEEGSEQSPGALLVVEAAQLP